MPAPTSKQPTAPAVAPVSTGVGVKVVVVDDDEHIRELASLYLAKEGFDVTCAVDGTSAVSTVQTVNPALLKAAQRLALRPRIV